MTNQEWSTCQEPSPMLIFLHGKWNARLFRLTERAFLQRFWSILSEQSKCAFDVVVRLAEEDVTTEEIDHARVQASLAFHDLRAAHPQTSWYWVGRAAAAMSVGLALEPIPEFCLRPQPHWEPAHFLRWCRLHRIILAANPTEGINNSNCDRTLEAITQAEILRDIYGDLFQVKSITRNWLTYDILSLATAIYKTQAFDDLPILADAAEEAGCRDGALLWHLRDPGPHVRGCWALDLLAMKERPEPEITGLDSRNN